MNSTLLELLPFLERPRPQLLVATFDACASCSTPVPLNSGPVCWSCHGPLCAAHAPRSPLATAACSAHPLGRRR